jgi:hypothetical protein
MHLRSLRRRFLAFVVVICAATTFGLPAVASARLMYDTGQPVSSSTDAPGNGQRLPLADAALVLILAGAGYAAVRFGRTRVTSSARLGS